MLTQLFLAATLAGRSLAGAFGANSGAQKPLGQADSVGNQHHANTELGDQVAAILEDAQSPQSCVACESFIVALKTAASMGDDLFVRLTTELCKSLKLQDDDVCEGSIALEGPIVARAMRQIIPGSRTSILACTTFFGLCPYPKVKEHRLSFPAPNPQKERPGPSGKKPLHVVHYSDIHVDPFYAEGADANCSKPICCRRYNDSQIHENAEPSYPAGPHGEHTCDSPISLEQSMYKAIEDLVPDAALTLFTGDMVDHAIWNTSESMNSIDILGGYARMDKAGMLVYGTAGNHEASPSNSYPPREASDGAQWLYNVLSSAWSRWINTDPLPSDMTKEFAAYSVKYRGGNLRIISLNTNLYYAHNYWLYEEPMRTDPDGQLAWLVDELDRAEQSDERVYIIGHMPMGSGDAFHDSSNYFDQIVNRYSSTIAALFFGHTHLDEFEISYNDYGSQSASNAVAMSYIAPSMTPTSGHPSFRVYTVDPDTFGVLDATTYIANMSDPSFQTTGPRWTRYYSAKRAYGTLLSPPRTQPTEELTPAFWHELTNVLEHNATAFDEYFARKSRGWTVSDCDQDCRKQELCKMRAARAQDNCMLPGLRFLSEGLTEESTVSGGHSMDAAMDGKASGTHVDECGGSVIQETLTHVARRPELLAWVEQAAQSGQVRR
ncbi:sphingomyelin phosphodiesterase [Xylariaceae sp. FL0804]|nr:sphingomyelin phosphodiesterase [Xylariaceae sp. FL0804]